MAGNRVFLKSDRVGNDCGWMFSSEGYGILESSCVRLFTCEVVLFVEIEQIDHRLGCQKAIFVKILNFSLCPVGMSDLLLLLLQTVVSFHNSLVFLTDVLVLRFRCFPAKLSHFLLYRILVFYDKLISDNLDISHWIHRSLSVSYLLSSKGSQHMVQSIYLHHVC